MSAGAREVREEPLRPDGVPLWRHPEWAERFPWLVQGTTGAEGEDGPFDLGLFGAAPAGVVVERWRLVRRAAGIPAAVHARQVHGGEVRLVEAELPPGLLVTEGFDGHATARAGALLSVSVADCVPVSVVDPRTRALALLHAGWRGVAAGILERGVALLAAAAGSRAGDLWLHCGPAICGQCYEVGPEVHRGVRPERAPPAGPTPIDLRAALVERAVRLGVPPGRCTVSGHCTRCGPGAFFSHRGGAAQRQMGLLGRRE